METSLYGDLFLVLVVFQSYISSMETTNSKSHLSSRNWTFQSYISSMETVIRFKNKKALVEPAFNPTLVRWKLRRINRELLWDTIFFFQSYISSMETFQTRDGLEGTTT